MIAKPAWFRQLTWSAPVTLQSLRIDRSAVPRQEGLYIFTQGPISLTPARVLYVGESNDLHRRLGAYTVDYMKMKNIAKHRGRLHLFSADHMNPCSVYYRWVIYGGHRNELEASLIEYLRPEFNIRDEAARFCVLNDEETLNRDFLM